MDFEETLTHHLDLHHFVSVYAEKPDGSLKADDVRADDKCALGQWLRAAGADQQGVPEYATLKEAHARVHQVGADIVGQADAGTLNRTVLSEKGEHKMALVQFLSALMAIKSVMA